MNGYAMTYPNLRHQVLSSIRLGRITVVLATVIAGILIHGMHVSKLGLYWDDSELWLQPMQWADGNVMRFILSDTFGMLRAERPLVPVLTLIHRAAFASSLSALHWSVVLLLILSAVMLESIASKIANENWYVFAVGIIFLSYPLAPLHSLNAMNVHHLWACLLALLTIWASWYGLRPTEMRRLMWFTLAAVTYIASILTHEVFALIPLVFLSLFVLSKNGQNTTEWHHFGRMSLYKPAIWWLSLFMGILVVYGLWRILILPMYGTFGYPNSQIVLNPILIAKKVLADIQIVFIPWFPVLERISWSPPPIMYVFLSAILFIITWIITVQLLLRSLTGDHTDYGNAAKNHDGDRWVRAAMIGTAMVIAAVVAIGVSPERIHVNFGANALSPGPRVNFVATIGIALALPALFALLLQWCHRYIRLVQRYPSFMRLLSLASLTCLIYVGFIGFAPYGSIFAHKSSVPVLFAHYSLLYGLIVIAYVMVMLFVIGTIALSAIPYMHNNRSLYKVNPIESVLPHIRAHCLSWLVACIVLIGTLFHFSIKEQFAEEWRRHKAMLEQLHGIAPAIKDDTFVIIVHNEPNRSLGMPYMTHSELSSFLLALYENWSIMGDTDRNIRFHQDGVEARYYEKVAMWLPPGVKGPINLNATIPVPHIAYDRILLFAFDGTTLHMLPEIEVDTEEDGHRVVKNNPERILNQPVLRTAIWRHVTE